MTKTVPGLQRELAGPTLTISLSMIRCFQLGSWLRLRSTSRGSRKRQAFQPRVESQRKARTLAKIEPNVRTFEAMKNAGLNTEIFSGGGTGTYNMQHLVPGFSDVQAGSYVFMDMQYLGCV